MLENIKFSVMIPVYNVEKYLKECIDSVLGQDYKNFEIILVDDGSTDMSGKICDEYAEKYDSIKVVHQENQGQYAARENALTLAEGEFCIYLDSDDFWEKSLLSDVKQKIDETQCDVVIFDRREVCEKGVVEVKLDFEDGAVFENDGKYTLYRMLIEGIRLHNLWLKVFRKDIAAENYDDKIFMGTCYGEDGFKSACLIIKAKRIVYLSKCLYNYRRGVGLTGVIPPNLIEKLTYATIQMWKLFENHKIDIYESRKKAMQSYMKSNVRYIIYSYMSSPEQFKESFRRVKDEPFYINARAAAYSKLSILEKIIIRCAEKEKYLFIKIIGNAVAIFKG